MQFFSVIVDLILEKNYFQSFTKCIHFSGILFDYHAPLRILYKALIYFLLSELQVS